MQCGESQFLEWKRQKSVTYPSTWPAKLIGFSIYCKTSERQFLHSTISLPHINVMSVHAESTNSTALCVPLSASSAEFNSHILLLKMTLMVTFDQNISIFPHGCILLYVKDVTEFFDILKDIKWQLCLTAHTSMSLVIGSKSLRITGTALIAWTKIEPRKNKNMQQKYESMKNYKTYQFYPIIKFKAAHKSGLAVPLHAFHLPFRPATPVHSIIVFHDAPLHLQRKSWHHQFLIHFMAGLDYNVWWNQFSNRRCNPTAI